MRLNYKVSSQRLGHCIGLRPRMTKPQIFISSRPQKRDSYNHYIYPAGLPCSLSQKSTELSTWSLTNGILTQSLPRNIKTCRIKDLFDTIYGSKIFIKIGITAGYKKVRIAAGDKLNMAFRTCYGSFECRVMKFSMINEPPPSPPLLKILPRNFS